MLTAATVTLAQHAEQLLVELPLSPQVMKGALEILGEMVAMIAWLSAPGASVGAAAVAFEFMDELEPPGMSLPGAGVGGIVTFSSTS